MRFPFFRMLHKRITLGVALANVPRGAGEEIAMRQ